MSGWSTRVVSELRSENAKLRARIAELEAMTIDVRLAQDTIASKINPEQKQD